MIIDSINATRIVAENIKNKMVVRIWILNSALYVNLDWNIFKIT